MEPLAKHCSETYTMCKACHKSIVRAALIVIGERVSAAIFLERLISGMIKTFGRGSKQSNDHLFKCDSNQAT